MGSGDESEGPKNKKKSKAKPKRYKTQINKKVSSMSEDDSLDF